MMKGLTKLGPFFFTALSILLASFIMTSVMAWYRHIELSSAILSSIGGLAINYLILGLIRLLRPNLFAMPLHSKTPASHSAHTSTE